MSANNHQPTHPPYPQSSPQSNTHYGDDNNYNRGIIGPASGNVVANDCQLNFYLPKPDLRENELDRLLYLSISSDALHNSFYAPRECHPGTRKTACESITTWASDPAGSPLLWLYGPAGVGKSVIAKTISKKPSNQIRIVAAFFFSTTSDKRATTLFPTLSWQLAKNVPETEQHIVAALNHDCSLPTSEPEQQFDQLIFQPLMKCASIVASGLVMVIDGVDECVDEKMQSRFLNILKRAGGNGDLPLRFLICSRPEPRIRAILETTDDDDETSRIPAKPIIPAGFDPLPTTPFVFTTSSANKVPLPTQRSLSLRLRNELWIKIQPYYAYASTVVKARLDYLRRRRPTLPSDARKLWQPLQLAVDKGYSSYGMADKPDQLSRRRVISRIQIGLSDESKDDIRIFLTDTFTENCSSDATITKEQIDELVKKSCGQFLYASIIVKLLDDGFSPKAVLEIAEHSNKPLPDLDKLYGAILDKVTLCGQHGINAESDLAILKDVFAILLVLWENAQLADIRDSFPIIECLLAIEEDELMRILRRMHSILDIIRGRSIRVYHRSFFEFLQHPHRSKHHCIASPFALQRFLRLLGRAVLTSAFRLSRNRSLNNDKKQPKYIRNMVLAFPRGFFRRSSNPAKLANFHVWVHTFFMLLLWTFLFWLSLDFWDYLIVSLVPPLCIFLVRYLLILVLFLPVSFGSFVISLTCYMWYSDRYPLFHPFLHPFFVTNVSFLLYR